VTLPQIFVFSDGAWRTCSATNLSRVPDERREEKMKEPLDAMSRAMTCPFCEAYDLRPFGHNAVRCDACGGVLSGPLLETLRAVIGLPEAMGYHACECGHPEMRRLPDGVYRCPACGSEVLPVTAPSVEWKSSDRSEAYWNGWLDGRYGCTDSFVNNRRLARLQKAADRLDYYKGHRDGREARAKSGRYLKAS
jgi:ribosomal protein L37AE/L43A